MPAMEDLVMAKNNISDEEARRAVLRLMEESDEWVFVGVVGERAAWVYFHDHPMKALFMMKAAVKSAEEEWSPESVVRYGTDW